MKIKIVHTADNHIGMKFSNYPSPVKEQLIAERIMALNNIVNIANNKQAHFLVVAGDLFDTTNVKVSDIKEVATLLNTFSGEAVIVLPGNHDYFETTADSLWDKFKKHSGDKKIFVLDKFEKFDYSIGDQKIIFYPACCKNKTSSENMIGWVKDAEKDIEAINIGIAHGNVTGLGLDNVDRYFNMSPEELIGAGVDFWLLGHIHVPFPTSSVNKNPGYFMPATHTPDGMNRKHHGYCWFIEVDSEKNVNGELLQTGNVGFYDLERTISSILDFEKLKIELNALDKKKSLLRIELNGRLSVDEIQQVKEEINELKKDFIYFIENNSIKIDIDKKYIDANYTKDSLPYNLLMSLVNEDKSGLELQLANELIEKLKS